MDWNVLDAEFRKKLDTHQYFSFSGNTKRAENELETNGMARASSQPQNSKTEPQIDYTTLELDSDNDSADETEIPEGSLFDYRVPGILTTEEVEKLNLNKWKLLVRNMFVDMEDLKGL